jgi:hypothetical protein
LCCPPATPRMFRMDRLQAESPPGSLADAGNVLGPLQPQNRGERSTPVRTRGCEGGTHLAVAWDFISVCFFSPICRLLALATAHRLYRFGAFGMTAFWLVWPCAPIQSGRVCGCLFYFVSLCTKYYCLPPLLYHPCPSPALIYLEVGYKNMCLPSLSATSNSVNIRHVVIPISLLPALDHSAQIFTGKRRKKKIAENQRKNRLV